MKPVVGFLLVLLVASVAWAEPPYDFEHVQWIRCYDGDTCWFHIPNAHPLLGENIGVRLLGIDTPELRSACEADKAMAQEAKVFLSALLRDAHTIHLRQVSRGKYFRLLAIVEVDGRNANNLLLQKGLATPYFGSGPKFSLCPETVP